MEEKKRLTATKAAIAKFREEHPTFTDDYLASSVEKNYPDLYLDNLEVAIEIVNRHFCLLVTLYTFFCICAAANYQYGKQQ